MKKLKVLCTAMVFFLGFQIAKAQDQANAEKLDSAKKTIKVTEKQEKKVSHEGITYYVIDGIWYTKMKNRYVLRTAPEGAKTDFIPQGGKLVTLGGKKYYKCKGVFYRKTNEDHYEIIRP